MRTVAEIDAEIEETRQELDSVRGDETEVYARIVGYYRSVRNWNRGKRDEYNQRLPFSVPEHLDADTRGAEASCRSDRTQTSQAAPGKTCARYILFTRSTCPHCPAVKQYMSGVEISGRNIDVDGEQGLAEAAARGVLATPTVIFYDAADREIFRAHNTTEIEAFLSGSSEQAADIA